MKRKLLITICLLIFSLQIKAQHHNYYVGLMSSVDFYNYYYNSYGNFHENIENNLSYHYGLKLQFDANNWFSLRQGIYFSRVAYRYDDPYFGTIYQSNPLQTVPTYYIIKNYFINIPFMAGFTLFSEKDFKFTPSIGLILNINNSSSFTTYYPTYTTNYTDNYNDISISVQLNLGFEYLYKDKFLFTLEPLTTFKYGNEINNGNIISTPRNFGIMLSVNYKLL